MNYTKLFYWLTVADNAKTFFLFGIVIFTFITLVTTALNGAAAVDDYSKDNKINSPFRIVVRKWQFIGIAFSIIFWSLYVFTPNKKDSLLIVAGGETMNFLTTDSTTKKIPHELSNFIVTELKNMASEAKVDLNIKEQKQKVLDEMDNMSAKELLEKMKTDSTYVNLILNK